MSSRKSYKQACLARIKKGSVEKQKEEHIPSISSLQSDEGAIAHDNEVAIAHDNEVAIAHDNEVAIAHDNEVAIAHDNEVVEVQESVPAIPEVHESVIAIPEVPVKVVIEDCNEDYEDDDHVNHSVNISNIIPNAPEHKPAYYSQRQHSMYATASSSSSSTPPNNIKAREDALEERINKTFGVVISNEELIVLLREAKDIKTPRSKDLGDLAKEIQVGLRNSMIDHRNKEIQEQMHQVREARLHQMKEEAAHLLPAALLSPKSLNGDQLKELSLDDRLFYIGRTIVNCLNGFSTQLLRISTEEVNNEFPLSMNFYFAESKHPIKVLLDIAGFTHPGGLNVALITVRSLGVKPAIIFTESLSGSLELTGITFAKFVVRIFSGFLELPELSD
jgi:hypothetical protein